MSDRTWQGIPDWLIYAVRWQHAQAMTEGRERAGEDAVQKLTNKVLAGDPAFTRVIVERYVRSLVRAPKPRRRKKNPARDRVMADCVRMAAEGLSLRQIGAAVGVNYSTASRLIAEWQTRLPEMPAELVALSQPAVARTPVDMTNFNASVQQRPNVIPLRRPA